MPTELPTSGRRRPGPGLDPARGLALPALASIRAAAGRWRPWPRPCRPWRSRRRPRSGPRPGAPVAGLDPVAGPGLDPGRGRALAALASTLPALALPSPASIRAPALASIRAAAGRWRRWPRSCRRWRRAAGKRRPGPNPRGGSMGPARGGGAARAAPTPGSGGLSEACCRIFAAALPRGGRKRERSRRPAAAARCERRSPPGSRPATGRQMPPDAAGRAMGGSGPAAAAWFGPAGVSPLACRSAGPRGRRGGLARGAGGGREDKSGAPGNRRRPQWDPRRGAGAAPALCAPESGGPRGPIRRIFAAALPRGLQRKGSR